MSQYINLTPITLAGAIATIAIYSILYRENKVYRLFEHFFIGLASGYGACLIWTDTLRPKWWNPMISNGEWYWVFAFAGGMLYYCIYTKKYAWMSRLIIGIMMGLAAGAYFRGFVAENWGQLNDSFRPLLVKGSYWPDLNNILFVVTLVAVMSYFFFSFEHKTKAMASPAKLGRWLLMIAFGAMFGSTVMARMSLFIGRLWFMFRDFIHLFPAK